MFFVALKEEKNDEFVDFFVYELERESGWIWDMESVYVWGQ